MASKLRCIVFMGSARDAAPPWGGVARLGDGVLELVKARMAAADKFELEVFDPLEIPLFQTVMRNPRCAPLPAPARCRGCRRALPLTAAPMPQLLQGGWRHGGRAEVLSQGRGGGLLRDRHAGVQPQHAVRADKHDEHVRVLFMLSMLLMLLMLLVMLVC